MHITKGVLQLQGINRTTCGTEPRVSQRSLQGLFRELPRSDPSNSTGMKDVGCRAEQAWDVEEEELRKRHSLTEGVRHSWGLSQAKTTRVSHHLRLVCPLVTRAGLTTSYQGWSAH